jgi:hypothetical protein
MSSRKTIGFGGKRLPGSLKHNGEQGREAKATTEPGRETILQLSGRWGWAATLGAGMCGEEDSSAVRRRNDNNLAVVVELACETILSGS